LAPELNEKAAGSFDGSIVEAECAIVRKFMAVDLDES
jgi:hypothetical protein